MTQQHDNYRQFKRIKVAFIVLCKVDSPLTVRMLVGNKEFDAIALDVSEGGMAILANYEIPASTLVTTKFMMVNEHALHDEDRFRSMEIPGEVRYSRPAQDRTYRLGIQFTGITAGQRDFIAHFIKTDPFRRGSDEAGGME